MLRVLLFGAAFPFFNNVDEEAHVDLVLKYARGDWPSEPIEHYDRESGRLFLVYGSPGYFGTKLGPAARELAPLWSDASDRSRALVERGARRWSRHPNHEAHSPPVYYLAAAGWYRIGAWLGLSEGSRLYWIRFLDAPIVALLVWIGYLFAREALHDLPEARLAVPFLLALMPQDVFYSVNSDVLSPLLFASGMLLLWRWTTCESPGPSLGAGLGALVGACFLVKYTNLALPLMLGAATLLALHRARWRTARTAWLLLPAAIAALPVLLFFAWNRVHLGDFAGTQSKVEALGWSVNGLGGILRHPLFSPEGAWTFWKDLLETFWRGEFVWRGERIASPSLDRVFVGSSTLFLLAAAFGHLRNLGRTAGAERAIVVLCWASVLLSIACLGALSVAFDYGASAYPSRESPYLISGRLIGGMLVPFLCLYVRGVATLVRPWSGAVGLWVVVASLGIAMGAWELAATRPFFDDPHNYFHLP